jgi:phage/plasmid primase, P4 family, C-terminal domain
MMEPKKEEVKETEGEVLLHLGNTIEKHKVRTQGRASGSFEEKEIVIGYNLTGEGNARRFVDYFGDVTRYCKPLNMWYIYNGELWKRDEQDKIMELAKEVASRIYTEANYIKSGNSKKDRVEQDKVLGWAKRSESAYTLKEMIDLAGSEKEIRIMPEELDANTHLVNFPNGTLDLTTREFREHRKEDMLSRMTKVNYNPAAESKYFYPTLLNALPVDVVTYLQRVFGSFLEYSTKNKEILILYGAHYAAKSSITQAIYNALGDYASSFPKELLQKMKNPRDAGSANPALISLDGLRLAWTEETDKGMVFEEAIFRSLTSTGVKSARGLYERQRQLHLGASFIIETNAPPTIDAADENSRKAMLDRILLAPFLRTIPEEKRDKNVMEKMSTDENELMVALAWIIDGYFLREDHGLQVPESVQLGKEEYEIQVNPLHDFIESEVIFDDGANTAEVYCLVEDLYHQFHDFEGKEGEALIKSKRSFQRHFRDIVPFFSKRTGITVKEDRVSIGAIWRNVRLRDADDAMPPEVTAKVWPNREITVGSLPEYTEYTMPHNKASEAEGVASEPPKKNDSADIPKPAQVAVARAIYVILRDFKHAGGRKVEYTNLKSATCDKVLKEHRDWKIIDLGALFDKLAADDPKIMEMVKDLTKGK